MKLLLSVALTTISINNCINNFSDNTLAQTTTPAPTTPQSEIPLPLVRAAPLVQAVSRLLTQQTYQIESAIELTTAISDSPAAQAQIRTIIAAPNKVNTEITFFDGDTALEQQYQIVANGTQVWIYDLEANQYSVSEYKQFLESTTSLSVGILANFYVTTLNRVNNNKIASRAIAKLPPDRLVKYFQRYANIDLQNMVVRNEQLEGQPYAVYDIDATDRTYKVTAFVSPQSSNIERVNLIGQQNGLEILMSERVTSHTIPEAIAEDTFNFIPPNNAEQIDRPIIINPLSNQ